MMVFNRRLWKPHRDQILNGVLSKETDIASIFMAPVCSPSYILCCKYSFSYSLKGSLVSYFSVSDVNPKSPFQTFLGTFISVEDKTNQ